MKSPFKGKPYRICRNKSWRASALLGLKLGVWWLPTNLLGAMVPGVVATICGFVALVATVAAFLFANTVMIIAGLCGYLTTREEPKA